MTYMLEWEKTNSHISRSLTKFKNRVILKEKNPNRFETSRFEVGLNLNQTLTDLKPIDLDKLV